MNKNKIIIIIISITIIVMIIFWNWFTSKDKKMNTLKTNIKNVELASPSFKNGQFIPSKFTCDGKDINPPLEIKNIPQGTKSLVLIIDDPDAPMGTWDHWLVWNINPKIKEIKENSIPDGGVEGLNSFGRHSYGGPCPPSGIHHYYFKIYALSKKLSLDPKSNKKDLEKAMTDSVIGEGELIGLYQKND